VSFELCVNKWCYGHDEEDVKMRLFVFSLEGDVAKCFSDPGS
jgi:hypothetical protein